MTNPSDEALRAILRSAKTIAVVGLSDKPWRPSHDVSRYMQRRGYRIIPINPHIREALGERAWPSLDAAPAEFDIVNVFRRAELVGEAAEAAIRSRAGTVWMQLGVTDENAARLLAAAGKTVVMDRCILQDHQRLIGRR